MTVWIVALLRPDWIPRVKSMPWRVRLRASVGMWKLGVLFFFAVFGIYLGWFSPTEAAAMAAFVAILIAVATGAMRWRGLIECMLETVYTTAAIFFIVVGAFIFSRFIVLTQFPNELDAMGGKHGLLMVLGRDGGHGTLCRCSERFWTR